MKSNRTQIALGQPVELTITAQYLNLSPALLYTFAGSNSFRLKLILPEGFIRTGGDYSDLISTELSPTRSFVRYTVTGYFTQAGAETNFRLLRSHSNADQTSLFVEKARLSLTLVNSAESVSHRQARESASNPANGNYEGNCDGGHCENLWGWVYDRNNPNMPIIVEMLANGQVVGTLTASELRQDLQNAGKGNGQHGFGFALPASVKNGQSQSLSLRVQGSNYILPNSTRTLTCAGSGTSGGSGTTPTNPGTTTPPPASNPSNGNYEGHFDGANCDNIWGWVYDRNNPNAPITVEVVANGQVVGSFSAAEYRQDLQNAGKGNGQHGFNFTPPASIKNGQGQSLSVRVQGSSYTLVNGPKTIQCAGSGSSGGTSNPPTNPGTTTPPPANNPSNGNYESSFDGADCGNLWGWVYDRNNPNAPITVEVVANGQVVASFSAAEYRQDLQNAGKGNGQHGFNFTPPASIKNGQSQSLSLRVQGSSYTLVNGPKTIQCAGSGSSGGTGSNPGTGTPATGNCSVANPKGNLDGADNNGIWGWAFDLNDLNKTVTVDIYVDGSKVGSILANESRPDLVGAFGNNPAAQNHGFSAEWDVQPGGYSGPGIVTARICGSNENLVTATTNRIIFEVYAVDGKVKDNTVDGGTLPVNVVIKAKRQENSGASGSGSDGSGSGNTGTGTGTGTGTAGGSGSDGGTTGESGNKPKPTFKSKAKQCEAYSSMWSNSLDFNGDPVVEVSALLTDYGVLIMPTSGRNCSGSYITNNVSGSRIDYFGSFIDVVDINNNHKTFYDLCDGTRLEVYGVIHTHPSTNIGNPFAPSPQDLKFAGTHQDLAHYIITKDGIYQFDKDQKTTKKVDRTNMTNCSLY